MNSRERFLIAMSGGQPDRVPCTPDFSNMIPCRLTGKPFWDVYLNQDPPLWRAYLAAADYFDIDAWFFEGALDFEYATSQVTHESRIVSRTADRIVQRTLIRTPDGDMQSETTFYLADPPTPTEKPVKDLKKDFAKLRHLLPEPTGYRTETAQIQKREIAGRYAFGTTIGSPGFQSWCVVVEGGVEPLAFADADCPEVLEELYAICERVALKHVEMALDSGLFDYVMTGGSGSITLASPRLFDKYNFPCIRKITRTCKEAGVPTMLHSCGKEAYLVKRCAEESDLNCVNPLEIPPMGDCDLAELKKLYGKKIALMGNLHTTDVMLRGRPEDVERAAKKCIDDAGEGGGFILSTGDQCGRDTPDENIRMLVEVCRTYGRYE